MFPQKWQELSVIFLVSKNQPLYFCILVKQMGGAMAGGLNAQGYSQAIQSKQLPQHTHITHSGVFNETFFQVGDRAKNLLEIHHGLAISNCDLYDLPNRNYFVSLFLKSSTDGQERTNPLNVVIALDISGSMAGPLKYSIGDEYPGPQQCRTALAKKAILMLFDKLKGDDVFSLVVFHQQARTIIESRFVKDLDRKMVEEQVTKQFERGGTTVAAGFREAQKNIVNFRQNNTLKNYEHRIVMLTDVGDNSVAGSQNLIRQISDAGVSTTIIGVSTDFRSQTCERLIQVKGFNYLCAVENNDLQTYLVDQFDYTFFPCIESTTITIKSQAIEQIEVFGSVDHDVKYPVQGNTFTVTKMKSGFPSALTLNKQAKVETKGGLILVKFTPKHKQSLPKIMLQIQANYSDMEGKPFSSSYSIDKSIQAEQFYSDEAIKQGVYLFYYTQTVRNLLKSMSQGENTLSDSNKGFYLGKLDKLKGYCPASKMTQLQSLRDIVEDRT